MLDGARDGTLAHGPRFEGIWGRLDSCPDYHESPSNRVIVLLGRSSNCTSSGKRTTELKVDGVTCERRRIRLGLK